MAYSTSLIQNPYVDVKGLQKIHVRLIHNRTIVYAPTEFKVTAKQFNGWITNHPNKDRMNTLLRKQLNEINNRLQDAMMFKKSFTKAELNTIVKGESKDTLAAFIDKLIADKVVDHGTLRQYATIKNKIESYHADVKLSDITAVWMKQYERHLKTMKNPNSNNTINTNMKRLQGILTKAAERGLIDKKTSQGYTPPPYIQEIPEYLEQSEVADIFDKIPEFPELHQTAGYYFLLGCRAGYRISDLKTFSFDKVKGERIILRAKKNGKIASLLIYPELQKILDKVKDRPFSMAEETMRKYVKEICRAAGIKRNIKIHTARHTFGMMLADKGFSIDEIAELLGDTPRVARIYARISNSRLDKQVREKLS
jgi:site-specific recombinase XerD